MFQSAIQSFRKISIKWQLLFICFVIVSVPIIILGILSYYSFENRLVEATKKELSVVAKDWKLITDTYVQQLTRVTRREDVLVTQRISVIAQNIHKSLEVLDEAYGEISLTAKQTLLSEVNEIEIGRSGHVFIVDGKGTYIQAKDPARIGKSIYSYTDDDGKRLLQSVITKAQALGSEETINGDYFWKDASYNSNRKQLVAASYFKPLDYVIVAITYTTDYRSDELILTLQDELKSKMGEQVIGEDGYIWAINSNGDYIVSKDRIRDGENIIDLKDTNGELFIKDIIEQAKKQKNGEAYFRSFPIKNVGDKHSERMLGAFTYNSEWDWIIGVGRYEKDYLEGVYEQRQQIAFVSIIAILLGSIIAYIFAGYIAKSVINLRNAALAIAKGDLTKRVNVQSSDEIGQLGTSFNDMAIQLSVVYSQLKKKTDESSKIAEETKHKNDTLEQTKEAMLNLLDDSKTLETKLKEERDQVSTVINSITEGLVVLDSQGLVKTINPAALKMLEVRAEDAIGKRWDQLTKLYIGTKEIPMQDRPSALTMKSGKEYKVSLEDNFIYHTQSEKQIPVAITTSPITNTDGVIGCVNIFRDITQDKLVKNRIEDQVRERTLQLKEEHARLESSINSLNIGFVMTDTQNEIMMINGTAKQLLAAVVPGGTDIAAQTNWLNQEFTMDTVRTILKPYVKLDEQLALCLTQKKQIEIQSLACGQKTFHFFLAPIVTLKEKLEVIGVVLMIDDITEEKAVERSRDEFFSIASHELRTPLTAIKGNTSMIKDIYGDKLTDPDLKQMIDDIHDASGRLINIVNDFLNVSRLEMGRMVYKNEAIVMKELVEHCIKDVESLSLEKHITMQLNAPEELPMAFGDQDRLKEVVTNLLSNAIKFTDQGGILVTILQENQSIKVSVIDSGKGIPVESQSLLFRKFQQASNNILTRDNTRSTGLGLYISKLMVEGMGGKIYLEHSEVEKGSTFSVILPIATAEVIAKEQDKNNEENVLRAKQQAQQG